MQRPIYVREEFYKRIVEALLDLFSDRLTAIVLFGSTVYMGGGRDVDLLVVLRERIGVGEKLRLEYEASRRLARMLDTMSFDVHVLGLDDFRENLAPGSFLSGLALGYEILFDRCRVEDEIERFLEKLAEEDTVLHNRYGSWNLGFHARLTLRLRRRRRKPATPRS